MTCENCGCRAHEYGCVNCNEEAYIQDQYLDLDMEIPEAISGPANEQIAEHALKLALSGKGDV